MKNKLNKIIKLLKDIINKSNSIKRQGKFMKSK